MSEDQLPDHVIALQLGAGMLLEVVEQLGGLLIGDILGDAATLHELAEDIVGDDGVLDDVVSHQEDIAFVEDRLQTLVAIMYHFIDLTGDHFHLTGDAHAVGLSLAVHLELEEADGFQRVSHGQGIIAVVVLGDPDPTGLGMDPGDTGVLVVGHIVVKIEGHSCSLTSL